MRNSKSLIPLQAYISFAHVVLDELAAEWRKLNIENSKDFPIEMSLSHWNEELLLKLEE